MMFLKAFALTGALLFAPVALAAEGFFDDSFGNLKEDLTEAKTSGKKGIFVFFEMDECPFCHRMKTTVFNQPKVQEYFNANFVRVPIDIEGDVEMVDFSGKTMTQKDFAFKQHRVRATPVMAIFDLDGKLAVKFTGPTKSAEEFLAFGEFYVSGKYKEPGMSFARYKSDKGL
ncbi:MAG: thioredoxin family protein [Halothiobacillaceae bacterium]|nr:thioredoxin family protein [Halothiobacillaceae bacterium]